MDKIFIKRPNAFGAAFLEAGSLVVNHEGRAVRIHTSALPVPELRIPRVSYPVNVR